MNNRDGSDRADPAASDPVPGRGQSIVGDNVAFVVAETRAQAKDAAELIEVDYETCRPWPTPPARWRRVPPQVHPEAPGNIAFDWHYGDEAGVPRPPSPRPRTSPSSS